MIWELMKKVQMSIKYLQSIKNIGRIQKLRIWDVREAMYPEKMTTEPPAEAMDEIAENTVQEVMLDLQSGNIHYYIFYSILC